MKVQTVRIQNKFHNSSIHSIKIPAGLSLHEAIMDREAKAWNGDQASKTWLRRLPACNGECQCRHMIEVVD